MVVKRETDEEITSDLFLTAVSEIAFQHDCKPTKVEYDEKIGWWVELDGLPKNQNKVFRKLGRMFKRWEEKSKCTS
jgi:hypothetical protein